MSFAFIITSYNPGNFVLCTIKSILNQTYSDFEIIYLDDNSTDNSFELIYTLKDPRLKIYKNDIRLGLIFSLNLAISLTDKKYIIRFDSDDILLPTFLETRLSHLSEDLVLLGENILITDSNLKIISKTKFPSEDRAIKNVLFNLKNSINQPGVLLKKDAVLAAGGYKDVKAAEDFDLWIRLIKHGEFKNTNTYLVLYRVTGNSLTNKTFQDIAKTMILSLSNYDNKIINTIQVKMFLKFYNYYNYKRGFSLTKLFYYPIYTLYRTILGFSIKTRFYKSYPAANASL
jgi:glycosyltransferase involved in cell wall biosynthesis